MSHKKVYTNSIAQIGGKIMTALISIFLIKILTNYLDVAGYGMYSKIYNYLSIFAVIADLGLYTISVRELAKYQGDPDKQEEISANVLTLRTISGIGIILLSLIIAPWLSGYDSVTALIGIAITSIFTLLGLLNSSLMSYLQATLRAEFSFVTNTLGKLTTFLLVLLFSTLLFTVQDETDDVLRFILVMTAGLIGNMVMFGLTFFYTKQFIRIRYSWNPPLIIGLLKESLPYGLALFLGAIFFKVDTILLSVLESKEIADVAVALYALPMKIVEVGMMYGTIFLTSLLPVLTDHIEKNRSDELQKTILRAFEILFIFGLGLSLFLGTFSKEILLLLSGPQYINTQVLGYSSVDALEVVAWVFLFYFISSLFSFLLIARGEQKKIIIINAVTALINIIGNWYFIPQTSFVGASYVTLVSQVILIIMSIILLKNTLSYPPLILRSSIILVIGGISMSLVYFLSSFSLLQNMNLFFYLSLLGIIFGILYLGSLYILHKFLAIYKSTI